VIKSEVDIGSHLSSNERTAEFESTAKKKDWIQKRSSLRAEDACSFALRMFV
jgi:hypothetical protein